MARVAFYTFGILHETREHPQSKGFYDRVPFVFESAENSEGFVDRAASRSLEDHDGRWGESSARPRFFVEDQHAPQDPPATISLWEDLESVYAFAYYGRHAEALSKRKEWFIKPEWPSYVAWWVEDDHIPAREEAAKRLEHLHENGSTSYAFDFKSPFDANGQPIRMDPAKIQERSQVVKDFDESNPTGL